MLMEGLAQNGALASRIFGRAGQQSQAVIQAHGRYLDAALRGNLYFGANALGTPVTTQAGLSATTPALTLYNPQGSGVLLALYGVTIDVTTSPAAACGFALAANDPTAAAPSSVTNATIYNALSPGGPAVGAGRCYRIATLAAAPVAFRMLGGVTGASAISGVLLDVDLGGSVVIPEGGCVSIQSTTAAAIIAQFLWEEIASSLAA